MNPSADVIVIGGGIAGLEATRLLSSAGLHVILLEARDRLGGRILTTRSPDYPVELGAEFVHGRPPEIFSAVSEFELNVVPVEGKLVAKNQGRWQASGDLMQEVNRLFDNMPREEPDQSFAQYIARSGCSEEAREHALNFVQGFHAADPEQVSVHWLIETTKAEEQIDGERSFRLVEGYESLVRAIESKVDGRRTEIHYREPVSVIEWKPGAVSAKTDSADFRAGRAIITVPLSILKFRVLRFDPPILQKDEALRLLETGPVIRVSLSFREKFWDRFPHFRGFSFMFTDEHDFPTWWSPNPLPFPVLTGWMGGPRAASLASYSNDQLIDTALPSLARIMEIRPEELRSSLRSAHTHNWQADPHSRGAYSYAKVGGAYAFRALAEPMAATLFFAGEATDFFGYNGTVHGAMASGRRAAREIIALAGGKVA